MGAVFDDFAVVHDNDAVHLAQGGQSVGDGDDGFAAHDAFQRFLDGLFAFAVEGGGGFVQNQDRGVFEDGAGDADALFLAAGEFDAALADMGFVGCALLVVGEVLDEVVGAGAGSGFDDVLHFCAGLAVADVLQHRAVEQVTVLCDNGDVFAQAFLLNVCDVLGADGDFSGGDVVGADEQAGDGRFSCAAAPDKSDFLACGDGEVEVLEDRLSGLAVVEGYVFEGDVGFAFGDDQRLRAGFVGDGEGLGQGFDAFLYASDIFEYAGNFEHDPVGLERGLKRHGEGHGEGGQSGIAFGAGEP